MNPTRLQYLLKSARCKRIAVIGDVMLDEFVWGKVSRISPEAPVPVVQVQSESSYPGGAANVARNLRAFCDGVEICGLTGDDPQGVQLGQLLAAEGIQIGGLIKNSSSTTIVKTRIIARHQQVVRVDREKSQAVPAEVTEQICQFLAELLPDLDGLIFEDYGKGLLTQALKDRICSMAGDKIVITADPNPNNPLVWNGVTTVKPNRGEAFATVGLPDSMEGKPPLEDLELLNVGSLLLKKWDIPSLLITLGEEGMILFENGQSPYHTPTRAQEVFDVSGAGDTAIALFTLALCAGATLHEAAEISNHASGVVVGKLGTATLAPEELLASFEEHAR